MKKYLSVITAISLASAMLLTGCSSAPSVPSTPASGSASTPASSPKDDKLVIAIAGQSADEYQKSWLDTFIAQAEAKGNIEVISTNADSKVEKQLSDIESLIVQKPDVIIIRAVDADGIVSSVEACNTAKIPVLASSYDINTDKYDAWVGANQKDNGILQSEFLATVMKDNSIEKLNLCYMWGTMGVSGCIARYDGLKENIVDKNPDTVKLLSEKVGNWSASDAMAVTEDWLQTFPEMNAIVCQNDEMAAGAANALKAAGVDMDKFLLLGIDGSANGQQYIKDGLIDATIFTDLQDEIATNLDIAVRLANGEKFSDKVYLNSYKLMTKDNIDTLTAK